MMPILGFFALAYLLSWWPSLLGAGGIFPFGPALAAVIVVWATGGRAGLRDWWRATTRVRGPLGWYIVAIALPVGLNVVAVAAALWLGAPRPAAAQINEWPHLWLSFLFYLVALGPLGEEPGWRGFAFRNLRDRLGNPMGASVVLGVGVAIWHLPLVIGGQQPAIILLAIAAAQIIYTWLSDRADGSVLIVMLAHAAQGGLAGEYFGPMFTGPAAVLETRLLVLVHCLAALAIVPAYLTSRRRAGASGPILADRPIA